MMNFKFKKSTLNITYLENENEINVEDLIVDFKTKNKEEFLILKNGTQIRLDKNSKNKWNKYTKSSMLSFNFIKACK